MAKTAIGIMALAIHLIICILIWSGIRTGFLKVKLSCSICTSLGTGVCPAYTFSAFFRYGPGENSGD